jgi:hypothetical protein
MTPVLETARTQAAEQVITHLVILRIMPLRTYARVFVIASSV